MAGALVRGQLTQLARGVRDDGHGGALATVSRTRVQASCVTMVLVVLMVLMVMVTPVSRVLDIELTLRLAQLTGAGEGVGVGGALGVAVTIVVTRGQREHSLVITRALDIDLLARQILLLLDRLLALLVPPLRDEGGHLHMHRI